MVGYFCEFLIKRCDINCTKSNIKFILYSLECLIDRAALSFYPLFWYEKKEKTAKGG